MYGIPSENESVKASVRRSSEPKHSKGSEEFLEWVGQEKLISEVEADEITRPSSFGGRTGGKSQLFPQQLFVLHMQSKAWKLKNERGLGSGILANKDPNSLI